MELDRSRCPERIHVVPAFARSFQIGKLSVAAPATTPHTPPRTEQHHVSNIQLRLSYYVQCFCRQPALVQLCSGTLTGGGYAIGPGVTYGSAKTAPDPLTALIRSPSRFWISFSSCMSVQQVQQVARTQSDTMLPRIPYAFRVRVC